MRHIFKAGGDHKTPDGFEYSIKCVNTSEISRHLASGWSKSLEELETKPDTTSETKPKKSNAK